VTYNLNVSSYITEVRKRLRRVFAPADAHGRLNVDGSFFTVYVHDVETCGKGYVSEPGLVPFTGCWRCRSLPADTLWRVATPAEVRFYVFGVEGTSPQASMFDLLI
jgi:hypothetical protein